MTTYMRYGGPDCTCPRSDRERRGEVSTRKDAHYDECPRAAWNDSGRPSKRTNGPCTCGENDHPGHKETCHVYRRGPCTCSYAATHQIVSGAKHHPDCPSLYPAQQEPDALTRLVRYVRASTLHEVEKEEALSIISEAREEQRKAVVHAKNAGLEKARLVVARAAQYAVENAEDHVGLDMCDDAIAKLKDPEP